MDTPQIDCASEMYIEVDSKLSAMETFLTELRADPAARSLLLSMVGQLEAIVSAGLEAIDCRHLDDRPVRHTLGELRDAIATLPEDRVGDDKTWHQIRSSHGECRRSFSSLLDALFERCKTQRAAHRRSRPRYAAIA